MSYVSLRKNAEVRTSKCYKKKEFCSLHSVMGDKGLINDKENGGSKWGSSANEDAQERRVARTALGGFGGLQESLQAGAAKRFKANEGQDLEGGGQT